MNKKVFISAASLIFIVVSFGSSCDRNTSKHTENSVSTAVKSINEVSLVRFLSPVKNKVYRLGNAIPLSVTIPDSVKGPDSILYLMDGKRIGVVGKAGDPFVLKTDSLKLGTENLEAVAFFPKSHKEFADVSFRLWPAIHARLYGYKIVRVYPHDDNAFTEGLIYENGYIYESTGIKGESTLRKEKLKTGEVVKTLSLPSDLFGEGIATFGDKIVQITWKAQKAFVYDKTTFKQINQINYPMKEGWGMTFDGKHLIMSDGSANLYFLDKEYLSEINRLEVCDEHGPVKNLNELEYIRGEVWANVWQTDTIVRINPRNGEVLGKVDMTGLLKPGDRNDNTDVLNGIAYDPQNQHILVTGKNWPKLFEITVYPKK